MYKVIVFAGTTEGYEISRFLGENQIPVLACVATEYGSRSLKESSSLHVQAGRLDENEMKELFSREKPELVLDATHPYAAEVTSLRGSRSLLYEDPPYRQRTAERCLC